MHRKTFCASSKSKTSSYKMCRTPLCSYLCCRLKCEELKLTCFDSSLRSYERHILSIGRCETRYKSGQRRWSSPSNVSMRSACDRSARVALLPKHLRPHNAALVAVYRLGILAKCPASVCCTQGRQKLLQPTTWVLPHRVHT
jgi:hypothetical protein